MLEIVASTEIDAPAEAVWGVLVDLPRFSEWNPFIRSASGTPRVGEEVRVRVRTPIEGASLGFRATVLACEPNHQLRWRGHVLGTWVGDGEHTFTIEPLDGGRVRFVQREVFHGILPRLVGPLLSHETRRGFDAMNSALKLRAEAARSARARASCTTS